MLLDLLNSFLFAALLLTHFLLHNGYSLFAPESLACFFPFVFLLFLTAAAARTFKRPWLFYFGLIFLFFDLTFGFSNRPVWEYARLPRDPALRLAAALASPLTGIPAFLSWLSIHVLKHSAVYTNHLAAAFLLGWTSYKTRLKMPRRLPVILAVMLLTTLIQYAKGSPPHIAIKTNPVAPVISAPSSNVLVLLLDEHIGIAGIPDLPDSASAGIKNSLASHYAGQGFDVYPYAFSNYSDTHNSIPSLLNHSISLRNDYGGVRVRKNRLFDTLLARGYRLNIYQSTYMDFCSAFEGRYHRCLTYRENTLGYLKSWDLPVSKKIPLLAASFISGHKSELLKKFYLFLMHRSQWLPWDNLSPMAGMEAFRRIQTDLRQAKQGEAFFAHLLLPHHPYLFDAQCRLRDIREWETTGSEKNGFSAEGWERKYRLYLEQMACTHLEIQKLFEALRKAGLFENTVIVLMGDHGSRITSTLPLEDHFEELTPRQFEDNFSTLALVKKSGNRSLGGGPAANTASSISIAEVMADVFELEMARGNSDADFEKVYLRKNFRSPEMVPHEFGMIRAKAEQKAA